MTKRNLLNYRDLPPDPLNWGDVVGYYWAHRQMAKAIKFLDRIIQDGDMPMFRTQADNAEQKLLAWQHRIEILRTWGKQWDALAWACLACERFPDQVTFQAQKQIMMRQLGLKFSAPAPDSPSPAQSASQKKPDRWRKVAGMRQLKTILERDVILPLMEPELHRQYGLTLPNGVLLYGPPGCGKTHIARELGRILGFHFREVQPSELGSIYVHGTQQKIGKLFEDLYDRAPCMLFLDEVDSFMPSRENINHHYASEVSEFLKRLERCAERRILVIGATNRIDRIDSAILRPGRFDKHIYVGLPDFEARKELAQLKLEGKPCEELNWDYVARVFMDYTCAEIELLLSEAARSALARGGKIALDDIANAVSGAKPQFAPKEQDGQT